MMPFEQTRRFLPDSFMPLDKRWLTQWVQPHHLDPDALSRARSAYRSAPAPVVQLPNFLDPAVARMLHTYFVKEARFEEVYGLRMPDIQIGREGWLAAPDSNRLFKYRRLARTQNDLTSVYALMFSKVEQAFRDQRFLDYLRVLTDTPLGTLQSFEAIAYGEGDFVRPHSDARLNRRLGCILYLNPVWRPDYGGALHLHTEGSREVVVPPTYNSLVVFDVTGHDYHRIAPMHPKGRQLRLTLVGWVRDPY